MSRIALAVVVIAVCAGVASADVVVNGSTDWTQIGSQTWVLPAQDIPGGCGNENEPTCEPPIFLISTIGFASTPGQEYKVEFMDETGAISDEFFWQTGFDGLGYMGFWSDPTLHGDDPGMIDLGPLCTEDGVTGAVCSLSLLLMDGTYLNITLASDGEGPFDPFGAGFDTSDGISFTQTPEPSSLLLLGSGLFGVAGVIRRKLSV